MLQERAAQSVTTLHRAKHDVIFIQETKIHENEKTSKLVYAWKTTTDGEAYISKAGPNGSGGVAILLSANAANLIQERTEPQEGNNSPRYLYITGKIHGNPITLHSVYAPVERHERPNFFNSLPRLGNGSLHIMGGDLNCVMDTQLDCVQPTAQAMEGSTEMLTWCAHLNICDIWRIRHPQAQRYTGPGNRNRIDLILLSAELCANAQAQIEPKMAGSDHACPVAKVGSATVTRGRGHWQMPLWLIPAIEKPLNQILDKFNTQQDTTQIGNFSKLLKNVTRLCKSTHRNASRRWFHSRDRLQNVWRHAHNYAISNPTPANIEAAIRAREMWKKEATDAIKRKKEAAFDRHFDQAEKCSTFFFNRPASRKVNIPITEAMNMNGAVTSKQKEIQAIHCKFWAQVFSAQGDGSEPQLSRSDRKPLLESIQTTLTEEERAAMEAPLSVDEITQVIKSLPSHKATGLDGLRGEVFQIHKEKWAKILAKVFENLIHRNSKLPSSFRSSIVLLLYKKGNTSDPSNYRPISLLNTCVKILTKAHGNRLRRLLPRLVPTAQTGFVPGRCITDNLILIQDALHWAKSRCNEAVILSLDFAKAYDRVQWDYLHDVLLQLGFGPRWRHLIKVLYSERSARLNVNGHITSPFAITRGVLQGDPISPYLFVLQAVPLIYMMERLRNTHGIPLAPGTWGPPATFFADDTTIMARSPTHAVELYNITDSFCKGSGAKLNLNKCIAVAATNLTQTLSNGIQVLEPEKFTTILGLPIGSNISREQQVQTVINRLIKRCISWGHVGKTIEGRVCLTQSIIWSTAWYILSAIPILNPEAEKIQRIGEAFIGRQADISWEVQPKRLNFPKQWLYIPKRDGGFGMRSVGETLRSRKMGMLRQVFHQKKRKEQRDWLSFAEHIWTDGMSGWSSTSSDILFWKYQRSHTPAAPGQWNRISPWWRSTWNIWLQESWTIPEKSLSTHVLASMPVWNNRLLCQLTDQNRTLHRSANGRTTQKNYATMRSIGFLRFEDFLKGNVQEVVDSKDLYNKAVSRLAQMDNNNDQISKRTCHALTRRIKSMWMAAKEKWCDPNDHTQRRESDWFQTRWVHPAVKKDFTACSNEDLAKCVRSHLKPFTIPKLLKIDEQKIHMEWQKERVNLAQLAPTRRDLIWRLQRNGLPLGAKRIHLVNNAQVTCPHFPDRIETYEHLFWKCPYASNIWATYTTPWKNREREQISWKEIVTGIGVSLQSGNDAWAAQIWTIIRGCILRVIWLERNFRIFNPGKPGKQWQQRANQATLDIQAHMNSAKRRGSSRTRQQWEKHICCLRATNQTLWNTDP